MAGHSKWKNIMHTKAKMDTKRAKIFTKLGKELTVAVKAGGPNTASNSRLQDVITKCKASNMPNDNIKKCIEKAAGANDATNYEAITYEGYGPGGIAVLVNALTDNKNRTAAEVRHAFDKFGGNLGTSGCVSFMFEKKGIILIERTDSISEDDLMIAALEAGAADFDAQDEYFEISTEISDFSNVLKQLEEGGFSFLEADLQWIPATTTLIEDDEVLTKMEKLIDTLEDDDDVQNVWHNMEN